MNFNLNDYVLNDNNYKFETFRSTSNLLGNYALICKIPSALNKPIDIVCEIECVSSGAFEYGYFRFGVDSNNTPFINEVQSPNEFKIIGDKTSTHFNIYVKSNMAGGTVKIYPKTGFNAGFVEFFNLSTFTFLESQFTLKVTPVTNNKFINSPLKINGGIELTDNLIIDGKTSAKASYVKRENSGIINRLFSYVSNLGYAVFGRCKDNSDSLSDVATSIMFTENDIRLYCQNGGAVCPDKPNQYDLGKNELRFNRLFLNKGIILADTKPSTPINCESYFDTTLKKVVTYWGGKWYSDGVEVSV